MIGFYFSHRKLCDYGFAAFVPVLIILATGHIGIGLEWPRGSDLVTVSSAIMGVAASLLGLVLATSTFLVVHVKSDRFEILTNSKSWSEFPKLVKSSLWRLFFLTLFSGITTSVSDDMIFVIGPILIFFIVLASFALAALIWITTMIISIQDF